jgi:putative flavoprotein involved in K+ transport
VPPETVVVGAGQAGLAVSHELGSAGVEHVVLERGRVGQRWRRRWSSFCLVTPNWSVRLPGGGYDGDDPDGFMARDEVVDHVERYAARIDAPVREGVGVESVTQADGSGFRLETTDGDMLARNVVLCTGAYERPHRPAAAASLPHDLLQLDVDDYTEPADLPAGPVLVVGSGQSGGQIAEELHLAGREVVLACGRVPWITRRVGDQDAVWWLLETGFLDAGVDDLPTPGARLAGNVLTTGHGGGRRDLHLRTLQALGVRLAGHLEGVEGRHARFADDLAASVAWGDEKYRGLVKLFRDFAAERGLPDPDLAEPEPFRAEPLRELDLGGFGAVLFASGYRPDHARWVRVPGAFDALGFPVHRDGASTVVPGLWFAGVHFLRKRKSALLVGVGEDAALVARGIAAAA